FRAKVVDVTQVSFVLEATGDEGKLEALIELLRPMGIQEIVRTGKVAIARGPKTRPRKAEPAKRPRVSEDPRVVGFADQPQTEERNTHAGGDVLRPGRRCRPAAGQEDGAHR